MSPELIEPDRYGLERAELTPQSDIYAFSMVLWEIFTGRLPFYGYRRDATVMSQILRGITPRRPAKAAILGLSDEVWAVMELCWQTEWQKRPHIVVVYQRLREAQARREGTDVHHAPEEWPLELDQ